VTARFLDGTTSAWNLTFDSNGYVRGTAKVSDVRARSQKVWTSQTAAGPLLGLTTAYDEGPAGGTALLHFAKAVGAYKDGMGGLATSKAWNAKLKEKCK